jgi:thiamine pyrophosphate-dependent acetolactate synthase large subunit-like protein
MVLNQILTGMKGKVDPDRFKDWRKRLADGVAEKLTSPGANKPIEDGDIHPLRLCEEINNFIDRDAILVVDGQEVTPKKSVRFRC